MVQTQDLRLFVQNSQNRFKKNDAAAFASNVGTSQSLKRREKARVFGGKTSGVFKKV